MAKDLSAWENPAAPSGTRDVERQAEDGGGGSKFSGGLSAWRTDADAQGGREGYVDRAQAWWSGASSASTASGWTTEFYQDFQDNWNKALEAGTAKDYFSSGGSGVVLWDHDDYKFGDVVEKGKSTGNLYDQYDRNTANLMLLPLLADGKTIGRMVDTPDKAESAKRIDEYVRGVHSENNENIEKAAGAAGFQSDMDATEAELAEGGSRWGIIGAATTGSAVTGAATGALLTSWLGPGAGIGAVVGGAIGGVVGGVGAVLNQDELIESTARATEITKLAYEENDAWSATGTLLSQAGQLTQKFTTPLTNLSHGITDTLEGDVGDGTSERYATDDKGESTASKWSIVADVTAAVGDGLLQFASPLSRLIYTGQMSATIGGEVVQLSTTGEMFDPREGGFDNIFIDDDGNADYSAAAAGIMKIGIDAIQLGGIRGLARQAQASSRAGAGQRMEEMAGKRFIFDDAGKVVGMKTTMAIAAPSEMLAWGTVARDARLAALRRRAAGGGGVATYDDFYRAAHNLANGSSKLKTAVVNAMGEAYEEGAQYALEAHALDGDWDASEFGESMMYGAAGGLGMSMGATFRGANSDDAMFSAAYVLETVRRDGVEPDFDAYRAEWDSLNPMEKRIRSARTEADLEVMASAQRKIATNHAATLVATSPDAAKAYNAKKTNLEKALRDGDQDLGRTDAYNVIGGLIDVGGVNPDGTLATNSAPPEAVEASGATVLELLANRLEGLSQQEEFLGRRLTEIDPADTDLIAETTDQLTQASYARQFGEGLVADIAQALDWMYDDARSEAQVRNVITKTNSLLADVFYRKAQLNLPQDFTGAQEEWADAAAQFVSLLHSREPKLDTGSYVALLPRISEALTFERSNNVLHVNTDLLQAINGDFDGDKMRSENQLVLSRERYLQTRAGQNFTGAGDTVDIAEREFETALVQALAKGLHGSGMLHAEALGTMSNIKSGLLARYGNLMSVEAFDDVWMKFEASVLAGVGASRNVLLDSLAAAASEAITNKGRAELANEWLWASKIVRANLNAYQLEFRRLRNFDEQGNLISGLGPEQEVEDMDTEEGTQIRKTRATTDAQTLSFFAVGNSLFRKFQKIHYTWFASRAEHTKNAAKADLTEMAEFYRELAKNITISELELVQAGDPVVARVLVMLNRIVQAAQDDPNVKPLNATAAMTLLGNVKVKDVRELSDGRIVESSDNITLVQALLRRALDAEREQHSRTWSQDTALQAKHAKLRVMTIPNEAGGQPNAERAFLEIFGAIPFQESLGGNVGHLAGHTTPEQFLDMFRGKDNEERAQFERHFKNVPEYLDREGTTNIPYSMHEMDRGEITSYRAMMDAMLAVGHSELTFDPSKQGAAAFGGRMAQQDQGTQESVVSTFAQMRQALLDYRELIDQTKRPMNRELVQEMFQAYPSQARMLLDMIPDAVANAIYEEKAEGLHVAPWVYDMFTLENPEEALFFYWKNLLLARWNSTQALGRRYDKMDSRMMRLLYNLNTEPGRMHFEMLIRKLDTETDLNDFMVWLNKTPGFRRSGEAAYLPFVDDVVDFDSDEKNPFSAGSPSSLYRQALTDAATAAEHIRDSVSFRREHKADNDRILQDIKDARDGDPDPEKQQRLRQLEKVLQLARQLPRSFSPASMLALTQGAVHGVDAQSHAKGQTATSYKEHGEFQALMDAFAFVPGFERIMAEFSAYDLDGLRNNLSDLVRTSGVTMDPKTGRQIEWRPLTLDEAIDLLDNPRTSSLGYALLTPSAMDLTPAGLTEKLMSEANLDDLLSGNVYKKMFEPAGDNQLNADMQYLSAANAMLRNEGGNDDIIRTANNLAIVYTTSLGRVATDQDVQELTAKAYSNVARVLRTVGQLLSGKQGPRAVNQLYETAVEELEDIARARALPAFVSSQTGKVVKGAVNSVLDEVKDWEQRSISEITRSNMPTPDKLLKTKAVQKEAKQTISEIEALMKGRRLESIAVQYEMTGDETVDAPRKAKLVQYVTAMTAFPNRVPEAADAWTKLAAQRAEGATVELTDAEWDTLARAAMGTALTDSVTRVARHITVPPFPEAAKPADGNGDPAISYARFYKFMDPDFHFIATDLLDPTSAMATVAQKLHILAEQPRTRLDLNQQAKMLKETVLDREMIGTWDPGVFAQLVATEERMDSASAPPGIAAAGNGPKRWAWIAAATRRTGEVPDSSLLTTTNFNGSKLMPGADLFNLIAVQPAGAVNPATMPVAQLENRFFRSIKFNGVDVPLDQDNLGFEWAGAEGPNPYRYVSLERLRPVLQRFAKDQGLALADIDIEVEFFHPDSQPPGAWHNAFFEGMSHSLAPDGSESLIGSLWSDNGGQISKDTQWTIDAGKKGLRAIQPFRRPDPATQANIEAKWIQGNDLAAMLRAKAQYVVSYDDGSGEAGPAAFNSVYKILKTQHIVAGVDAEGNPVAWTADEVIAHQAANGTDAPLPFDTSGKDKNGLVLLSPEVTRTIMGDSTSGQGVQQDFAEEVLIDPDRVRRFEGLTPEHLKRFGAGWAAETGSITDTDLINVGPQRVLKVRPVLTDEARRARESHRIYLDARMTDVHAERYATPLRDKDAKRQYSTVLEQAIAAVNTETVRFDFSDRNSGLILPRDTTQSAKTARLLTKIAEIKTAQGIERGWFVRGDGATEYSEGILTLAGMKDDPERKEHWVVRNDLALVQLDSFTKPETTFDEELAKVEKALDFLLERGAYIALGSGNGTSELRFFASKFLEERGYEPVEGSPHLYQPREFAPRTQNQRAYDSSQQETKTITPATQALTFLALDPLELEENGAMVNPASAKLKTRILVGNLLPSHRFKHYNILSEDGRDDGLYARTLQHLRSTLNPKNTEARAKLLKAAGEDPRSVKSFSKALDDYFTLIESHGKLGPFDGQRLEVGDIIPFVHTDGRVILYRHGMKLPKRGDLKKMFDATGLNIAVPESKREAAATANSGVLRQLDYRAGAGRRMVLEVPVQASGEKVHLEWNGMKYILVPTVKKLMAKIPSVFRNGTVVDLISDAYSANSKEAYEGRIWNYRNALAFFQFDFLDDMVKFFDPSFDPNSADAEDQRTVVLTFLNDLTRQSEARIPFSHAYAIANHNITVAEMYGSLLEVEGLAPEGVGKDWISKLESPQDATDQIAHAVLTYLLTPGANVANVLSSAGFSAPKAQHSEATTRLVPGLFADLLDEGLDSALHKELIRRFNLQLMKDSSGAGFVLNSDWTVTMHDGSGKTLNGYLQFGEAHSSGDSPVLNGQAFNPDAAASGSLHNILAASGSLGAATVHAPLEETEKFVQSFTREGSVTKFDPEDATGVWAMLTDIPDNKDRGLAGWRWETPGETIRRAAAREEIAGFHKDLATDHWDDDGTLAGDYYLKARQLLKDLGLHPSNVKFVDTWVRQMLGRPYGVDEQGNDLSLISYEDAVEMLRLMSENVRNGLLPVHTGNVPLMDVNHLTAIYMANLNSKKWAPRTATAEDSPRADSWDAWVETAFGSAWIVGEGQDGIGAKADFHAMYLLAVDGFMHGYQGATTDTRYLPVSSDVLRSRLLMDEQTNKMLVSISADGNTLASDPMLYNSQVAELEQLIAGERIYAPGRNGPNAESAMGRVMLRHNKWHKDTGAPRQVGKDLPSIRQPGAAFIGYTTSTNSWFRSMMNLRVGNTLFNMSLVTAAPFEAFHRRTVNGLANTLTGDSSGALGRAAVGAGEAITDRLDSSTSDAGQRIAQVWSALGFTSQGVHDQLVQVNELTHALSSLPDFKALIYRELFHHYPSVPGINRVEKWLESYAKMGGKLQDPAFGLLPRDLARIYLDTAIKSMNQSPTGDVMFTVETLLAQMKSDPMWLSKAAPEIHQKAIAAVANVRSLKPNVLSLGLRGIVEPLSASPKLSRNTAGNMLKLLTAFQNFWANFSVQIAGLQGPAELMAFWLDGKPKKITARAQAAIQGVPYRPEAEEFFDLSEAIESSDLADAFIRGGVTHTGLFALGMMASGLGLSGEDEETKWRRKQAELQGVGMLYDPSQMENDFRNKDAIFLDWLPMGLDSFFKADPGNPDSRSLAQMNWVARTFLSPVIGFERFYNTGDFSEILHGFKDAIGSHPIVNQTLYGIAMDTATELQAAANDSVEAGDMVDGGHKLMSAVGVLERMLFENAMVNMIYTGRDEWDRDPYVLPLRDSDGDLQRDIENQVRPNDLALRSFINDEGEVQTGYLGRSATGAQARVMTENRATMAFVASLFSGGIGESDFWRYNMPIKTREMEKEEIPQETLELYIKAAAAFQLEQIGVPSVTDDEVVSTVRNQLYQLGDKTGQFFTDDQVWAAARQRSGEFGLLHASIIDEEGAEHLTSDGARRIYEGLRRGTMTLGSQDMAGVYIPYEMREKIAAEWTKEITQEGINLGLDETKAKSRMKRIMYGDLENPEASEGLADLLFSNAIPTNSKQVYGQLNTTYVMGPDGRPWATGFKRDAIMGALGIAPLKRMIPPIDGVTGMDERGNTTDLVNGMNTGLRGLVPFDDTRNVPTDKEIADSIIKAIKDAEKASYTPLPPFDKKGGGSGWRNFGRGGYRRSYGGGGYSGGGSAYFTKMYALPRGNAPYSDTTPFINTSNPILRRSSVRRERVWSERGRLRQWQ